MCCWHSSRTRLSRFSGLYALVSYEQLCLVQDAAKLRSNVRRTWLCAKTVTIRSTFGLRMLATSTKRKNNTSRLKRTIFLERSEHALRLLLRARISNFDDSQFCREQTDSLSSERKALRCYPVQWDTDISTEWFNRYIRDTDFRFDSLKLVWRLSRSRCE